MNDLIGDNIRKLRRKCGFTQEQLAARLSVTPQAVSKWENGGGLPDLLQIVPLAQIFGITTDTLLGVSSEVYGKAHTEAALAHEKLLMSSDLPPAEKHLAIYNYFRAEVEKEPTNYTLMRKCINHAAEISRYVDFEDFIAERPDARDEIFADCERKNACIARFCEDRTTVEYSDFAMAWVYIHTGQFEKAKVLIDRLPSLETNNLQESILAKWIQFQHGFAAEQQCIDENLRKLLRVTAKELCYAMEDYAWGTSPTEAIAFGQKLLGILESYKAFDHIREEARCHEHHIRHFLIKCYAANGAYEKAAEELYQIICSGVEPKAACDQLSEKEMKQIRACEAYQKVLTYLERMREVHDS